MDSFMKRLHLMPLYWLLPFLLKAQTVDISVTNATVSSGALEFDVNIASTSTDIFLGNSDLKFSYTAANFTGATFTRVSNTSNLKNAAGISVTYSVAATISSSLLTINIAGQNPTDLADFDDRVAKITTTPVRIGRFRLVTISNPAGTANLACNTVIIATTARVEPGFTESNVPLNACTIPSITLPVELVSFQGQRYGDVHLLSWETASEKNNIGFDIEKSSDGVSFQTIGFVKGHGTTVVSQQYQFTDAAVFGVTYYRLKQLDESGHWTYSNTISIATEGKTENLLEIFPNPTDGFLNVNFASNSTQSIDIELVNTLGQVVQRQVQAAELGANRFSTQLLGQVSGMYTLRVMQGRQVYMRRVCLR
jgi:Secretion system C-terminal sorting domain